MPSLLDDFHAAVQRHPDRVAIVDGKETALVPKMSGALEKKSYEADLSEFAGKKFEIRFVFDSDAGVVDDGPQIDNLSIQ